MYYLVPDCGSVKFYFEKLWPTSELNFAKSPPELGAGDYDFQLHVNFIS